MYQPMPIRDRMLWSPNQSEWCHQSKDQLGPSAVISDCVHVSQNIDAATKSYYYFGLVITYKICMFSDRVSSYY